MSLLICFNFSVKTVFIFNLLFIPDNLDLCNLIFYDINSVFILPVSLTLLIQVYLIQIIL